MPVSDDAIVAAIEAAHAEPRSTKMAAEPAADGGETPAPRRRRTRSRAAAAETSEAEATASPGERSGSDAKLPPEGSGPTVTEAPVAESQAEAPTRERPAREPRDGGQQQQRGDQQARQGGDQQGRQVEGERRDRNARRGDRRDRERNDRGFRPGRPQERPFVRRERDGFGANGSYDQADEAYEREMERTASERTALPSLNLAELQVMPPEQLTELADQLGLPDASGLRKQDLIFRLLQGQAEARGNIFAGGFLEVSDDGNYGFLRGERMLPGPHDIYVSQQQLRRYALRPGDYVTGQVRQPRDNEKYYGLLKVEAVNGIDPDEARRRPHFENLTAIFPKEQLKLETTADNLTHRLIDLVAPIGRGQRGLIVSPPKAGKTMLLKNIANGITENYPDVHLIVLLIGERPEEVTDMQRTVRGEVVSSTFDEPVEDHTRVAEMALERAKRLVESGKDVVILLDSITRLTRAYNLALPPSGRTLSGGVDPVALYPPKRLFGAARKCEEAGSLTVIATCLVDTGSRMDEVVFEEFKGTGNMELRLDRRLAERRFYPAIDIQASSTRREELILDEKTLRGVWLVRRMTAMISQNSPNQLEATERLLDRLGRTATNEEFIASLKTDL
ncbi:MAG: transcription termination factor Rho [Dehalococcoidia bacterium]